MNNVIQSLKLRIVSAIASGDINEYQANQIHGYLDCKADISTATELVDLKAAILATRAAGIIGDDQVGQIFSIIPELEAT